MSAGGGAGESVGLPKVVPRVVLQQKNDVRGLKTDGGCRTVQEGVRDMHEKKAGNILTREAGTCRRGGVR